MISRKQRSVKSILPIILSVIAALAAPTGGCVVEPLKASNCLSCALGTDCMSGFCVDGECCDTDSSATCAICKASSGLSCTLATDCASGFCIDGVCCDTECSGSCTACTAAKTGSGNDGVCGNIDHGLDPDDECPSGACSGIGTCRSDDGVLCTTETNCLSQHCAAGVCCDSVCAGPGETCNWVESFGTCVTPIPENCADAVELTETTVYPTADKVRSVVAADFDGDGQMDVATRAWNATYEVAWGQGNGTLGPMNPASAAEWISFVTKAADTNHNGIIELGEHLVEEWALWADFTNDGILDVIYHRIEYGDIGLGSNEWKDTVYLGDVLIGNADGTLTFSRTIILATVLPNVAATDTKPTFGAADFNGDGNIDIAVASYNSATIRLGDGTGLFWAVPVVWSHNWDYSASIRVADVNQDGHADVCVRWDVPDSSNFTRECYLGQGDGTFSSQPLPIAAPPFEDVNNDGMVDFRQGPAGYLGVALGHGDGTFGAAKSYSVGAYAWDVRVADMDNDGRNDIVTGNNIPPSVSIMFNRCVN